MKEKVAKVPPSPQSSKPSDTKSFRRTLRSRKNGQTEENGKRNKYTSANGSDWGVPFEDSVRMTPSARSEKVGFVKSKK